MSPDRGTVTLSMSLVLQELGLSVPFPTYLAAVNSELELQQVTYLHSYPIDYPCTVSQDCEVATIYSLVTVQHEDNMKTTPLGYVIFKVEEILKPTA